MSTLETSYVEGVALMCAAIRQALANHKEECIDCYNQRHNESLESWAIRRARAIVRMKNRTGIFYKDLVDMYNDMDQEIEFQKIRSHETRRWYKDKDGRRWSSLAPYEK